MFGGRGKYFNAMYFLFMEFSNEKQNPSRLTWMINWYDCVELISRVSSRQCISFIISNRGYSQFPAFPVASSSEPTFKPGYCSNFLFSSFKLMTNCRSRPLNKMLLWTFASKTCTLTFEVVTSSL